MTSSASATIVLNPCLFCSSRDWRRRTPGHATTPGRRSLKPRLALRSTSTRSLVVRFALFCHSLRFACLLAADVDQTLACMESLLQNARGKRLRPLGSVIVPNERARTRDPPHYCQRHGCCGRICSGCGATEGPTLKLLHCRSVALVPVLSVVLCPLSIPAWSQSLPDGSVLQHRCARVAFLVSVTLCWLVSLVQTARSSTGRSTRHCATVPLRLARRSRDVRVA